MGGLTVILCIIFNIDKTMDWQLEDEWFCVCSNIQRGWISHVYSRRYAAKIYLPGHLLRELSKPFWCVPHNGGMFACSFAAFVVLATLSSSYFFILDNHVLMFSR